MLRPNITWAKPSDADGVYGRLDGDLALSPSVGLVHYRGDSEIAVGLQAMYVSTVGITVQHADSYFLVGSRSVNRGVTSLDLNLYPLFVSRWSQAMEAGPPLLDLVLDSFMIGIGSFWDYDRDRSQLRRGASVSTGLSLPLIARAGGPWLSSTLALRFAEGPGFSAPAEVVYGLAFSWAWFIDSRLHDDKP
jgi:hypothetical protein